MPATWERCAAPALGVWLLAAAAAGAAECPYTLDWYQRNHGRHDNICTALYEQWVARGGAAPAQGERGAAAAEFATDINMSTPDFSIDENEFQIEFHPTDRLLAVAASNTASDFSSGVTIYRTTNGGASWSSSLALPEEPTCCDPGVAFSAGGDVYVTILDLSPAVTRVLKSTDQGASWTLIASPAVIDRPSLAIDNSSASPRFGHLYLTWFDGVSGRIKGYRSSDGGVNWGAAFFVGAPLAGGYQQASDPQVAADGALFVGYQEYASATPNCATQVRNVVAKSTDGGASFSHTVVPIVQGGVCRPMQAGRGEFCINADGDTFRSRSHPILGLDPSDPALVYMVYSGGELESAYSCGGANGRHSDTLLRRSTNGGASFSGPIKINQDPPGKDQYYPWLSVTPSGVLYAGWHDRRGDPNNFQHRWYTAASFDRGLTWRETVVSSAASTPSTFIGDYAGIAAVDEKVLGVWWDRRNGFNANAYTDPHVPPRVLLVTGSASGGGAVLRRFGTAPL